MATLEGITPAGSDDGAGTVPEPETSLRDDIDAAFAQHATDEVDEAPAGRARDDQGRFTRAEPQATAAPAAGPAAAPTQAATPAAPRAPIAPAPQPSELKAPASWTPSAREKWAGVDPELRSEIHRRESEAQRVLQDSAGLRDFARAFQDVVRPYEMFIRAENTDPLRAVQNLMNTAAELRVGSPQQKVNIVAGIVRQHGIDLKMLDDTLAQLFGVTQPGQAPQQPMHDPRVDQLLQLQQQQQWQAQQQAAQREAWENNALREGLANFASTHEFYADVADTMADLVDAATRRGQAVDLEKIYDRACQLDAQVSTILSQRAAQQPSAVRGQPATSQAVLRAKRAAVSVKGDPNPAGSTVPKNDSVRAAIEAAFDSHTE